MPMFIIYCLLNKNHLERGHLGERVDTLSKRKTHSYCHKQYSLLTKFCPTDKPDP